MAFGKRRWSTRSHATTAWSQAATESALCLSRGQSTFLAQLSELQYLHPALPVQRSIGNAFRLHGFFTLSSAPPPWRQSDQSSASANQQEVLHNRTSLLNKSRFSRHVYISRFTVTVLAFDNKLLLKLGEVEERGLANADFHHVVHMVRMAMPGPCP